MKELEELHKYMLIKYKKPKEAGFVQAYDEAKKRLGAIPSQVAAPDQSNKDNGSTFQAPSQAIDIERYANVKTFDELYKMKEEDERTKHGSDIFRIREEYEKADKRIRETEYTKQQNAKAKQTAKVNQQLGQSIDSQMASVEFRQDQGMNAGLNQQFSSAQIEQQNSKDEKKDDMYAPKGSMSAEAVVGTAGDVANPIAEAIRQAQMQQFQPPPKTVASVEFAKKVYNINRRKIPVLQQAPNQVVNQQPPINPARQQPKYKSYSPQELTALYAEREKEARNAKIEADAGAEQDRTIGDRAKTGLGTYEMKPNADVVLKSQKDKKKSIHNFANFNWIESRSDSKLGEFSSLKKMIDGEEKMRFSK
jgi:hypothetical protein